MSKKLIYVTTRLPWPQDSGQKVVLYNYCKGLHDLCDYDIYLYSFSDAGQMFERAEIPDFIKEVKLASQVKPAEKTLGIIKALLSKQKPLQCALYYSKRNSKALREYAERVDPDAIVVDMIRLAPYIDSFADMKCIKSLGATDLLSKRYKRQIEQEGGILGVYGQNAAGLLNRLTKNKIIRNRILDMEARRTRMAEKLLGGQFDSVFFVSETEANEYRRDTNHPCAFSVGMGVDVDYFSAKVKKESTQALRVIFVGNMGYDPNISSIKLIANEVLPKLRHHVDLEVVGACPENSKQELLCLKGVKLLGRVEDLRPVVKNAALFLAPIAYGSGVKTKIVEAMAMGMCVVTNSIGAEGLTAKNGVEIIVEDDYGIMAACIDELLDDSNYRASIGEAALTYANAHHRWDNLLSAFIENGF